MSGLALWILLLSIKHECYTANILGSTMFDQQTKLLPYICILAKSLVLQCYHGLVRVEKLKLGAWGFSSDTRGTMATLFFCLHYEYGISLPFRNTCLRNFCKALWNLNYTFMKLQHGITCCCEIWNSYPSPSYTNI